MAIYRGSGGAGDATVDATNASAQAVESAAAAAASAVTASNAAAAAEAAQDAAEAAQADAEAAQAAAETAQAGAETALASAETLIDGFLPDQTGNAGKYLTTDGTDTSWATVEAGDALPDQTGNSGKYLTTDGTTASWATVSGGGGGSGTVTSVAMTVPTGLSISGSPITTTGTLAVTYTSGYAIPTTSKQTNWDTAYGWGNHASAGYLTSYTETDPVFVAHAAYNVTNTKISNWDTAYGWGNHASAGYATNLDGLSDVTLTSPSAGQVLKYNGTAWVNDTDSTGGGGGATYLPILNRSGTSIEIPIAGGYITVTNRSGSSISIPVY